VTDSEPDDDGVIVEEAYQRLGLVWARVYARHRTCAGGHALRAGQRYLLGRASPDGRRWCVPCALQAGYLRPKAPAKRGE
jgi:hypothetical protein